MKATIIWIGLLALVCTLPLRAAEVRAKVYQVGADVDAQGKVTATQFDADVPPNIASVLTAAIKQWQFIPAKRDGQPAPAHTFIRVRLKAIPDAKGQYALRISFNGNGPRVVKAVTPAYPVAVVRLGASGVVLVEATVQPDGSLSDISVSKSSGGSAHLLHAVEQSVLAAARQWRYIPEAVDGQPVATRMHIPFHFETRTSPMQPPMAADDDDDTRPGVPLARDQEVALDSPVQPQSVATITDAP